MFAGERLAAGLMLEYNLKQARNREQIASTRDLA
jgi:hypothetical protein